MKEIKCPKCGTAIPLDAEDYAAILSQVRTDEFDSELYNSGIVDKSYAYDKMYVIRPQFFVPFIQLLVQTSRKTLSLRKELERAKNMHMDFTNFETKLGELKSGVFTASGYASTNIDDAIKQVDTAIKNLTKVKNLLSTAQGHLSTVDNKMDEFTVRKLTYGNSTVKEMIEQAQVQDSDADASSSAPSTGAA